MIILSIRSIRVIFSIKNLFRYILDYLRNDKVTLPEDFGETKRLIDEAKYFRLDGMVGDLKQQQQQQQNELIGKGIVPYYLEGRDKLSDKNYATSLCISGKMSSIILLMNPVQLPSPPPPLFFDIIFFTPNHKMGPYSFHPKTFSLNPMYPNRILKK